MYGFIFYINIYEFVHPEQYRPPTGYIIVKTRKRNEKRRAGNEY